LLSLIVAICPAEVVEQIIQKLVLEEHPRCLLLPTVIALVFIVVVSGVVLNSWRKEKRWSSRSRDRDL
jgi:serine/threonine protein kinase